MYAVWPQDIRIARPAPTNRCPWGNRIWRPNRRIPWRALAAGRTKVGKICPRNRHVPALAFATALPESGEIWKSNRLT